MTIVLWVFAILGVIYTLMIAYSIVEELWPRFVKWKRDNEC